MGKIYSENLIPIMTSDILPAPYVASASSIAGSATKAFEAFSKITGDYWRCATIGGSLPAWLKIDVGTVSGLKVNKYSVGGSVYSISISPANWSFQGSTDNIDWVTLHTVIAENVWVLGEKKEYYFSNTSTYRYYRLLVSSSVTDGTYIDISALEMFEDISPPIKHLIKSNNKMQNLSSNAWTEVTGDLNEAMFTTSGMDDISAISQEKWSELVKPVEVYTWTDNADAVSSTVDYKYKDFVEPHIELTVPEYRLIDSLERPLSILTYTDAETVPSLRQEYSIIGVGTRIMKRD